MTKDHLITALNILENIAITAKFHAEQGHTNECKATLNSLLREMKDLMEIIESQIVK